MTDIPTPPPRAARVLRFPTAEELVDDAATRMLDRLLWCQQRQDVVHLCLGGGAIANRVYSAFADKAADSDLDLGKLHVWWSDDRFVPTIDSDRHAMRSLSALARRLQLNTAQIHPVPASDGNADAGEAAFAYAEELGDIAFDLCILGLGTDGHVASIFPGHPSFEPTGQRAIGVQEAPVAPPDRISLTIPTLNHSRFVWFLAIGPEKADAVARALGGDPLVPASQVHGSETTAWFLDDAAASELPRYDCEL